MTNLLRKLINKRKDLSLSLIPLKQTLIAVLFIFSFTMTFAQNIVDFEELSLEPESHWNGSDLSGSFSSGYAKFYNTYTDWGGGNGSWNGFAYTNETDITTYSYLNEFSSASGTGVWSSENYVVSYIMGDWENNYSPIPSILKLDLETAPEVIPGMFVSLNAYSSLYMSEGDFYSNNQHWLKLHIVAYSTTSWYFAFADIMLADYRFDNSDLDYKFDNWTYVDLTWAEGTDSLLFYLESSDAGDYGVNTPAYFCIDNIGEECPEGIPPMETEINPDYYISSGESAQISVYVRGGVQPYSFEWSNSSSLDDYLSQTPLATPEQSTSYTVTVTDALGNQNTGTVNVWVDEVGINQNNILKPLIYINSGNLIIESDQIVKSVKVFDMTGKLLKETEAQSNKTSINLDDLSNGIYLVQTSDGKVCLTQKIMK
ncbi:MAG TPA: DUF4465 domain-containing protein [Bacteroidales bacterium]|nr:DUF4465 domain-containing protein [Bacteroidales bacterium]